MKTVWMIKSFVMLGCLGSVSARAEGIERVVVMADRAEVTRSAMVSCQAGRGQAVFDGIPEGADVRTLRGDADAPAVAVGTTSTMVELEVAVAEEARVTEGRLDVVRGEIRVRQDRIQEIERRVSAIGGLERVLLGVMAEAVRNPDPDRAAWGRAMDSFAAERKTAAEERIQLRAEAEELAREARKLELRLESLGLGASKRAIRAEVTVECGGASEVRARLSYVVTGARWHPEYDLRVDAGTKTGLGRARAELTVGAIVEQSTGEDWTGVKLLLSTAKPKLGSEAPVPLPIYVEGYEEKSQKVLVEGQVRREQLPSGQAAAAGEAESVAVDDKGQSFTLSVPHEVTLRSDGRPSWVPVDVTETQAEVRLVGIPKLAQRVFRVASFANPAPYPLLEGRVRSYRGDSYIGESRLKHRGLGEPLEVSLGIDDTIRVKRERQKQKDEGPGFLGNTKHLRKAYEISLESQAAGPVSVEIRENIPVSQVEAVEVELLPDTTAGALKDAERGFITFKVDLAPAQSKKLVLAYTIHLPDDWIVR
ncbi:MAG: mucoidy inhibitor MuiA family protein [Deltaproteobacteria bacterium]|nr:mucoidy inhibitor MuiA family protein [Deltaproteobacteria bacterium]